MLGKKTTGYYLKALFILIGISMVSINIYAHPTGMMHGDMDEDDMRGYMQKPGMMMGPQGYWGSQMGSMMGPGMMGPMSGMMMGRLYALDLDNKQKSEIRKLVQSMRKDHWNSMEKMMETSDQLAELYGKDKADPEKIGKVYEQIYKVKVDMIKQHIVLKNKIIDLLSKEQKEKFRQSDPYAMHFGMMF